MAQLYAGASGFAYPTWKPRFYPAKLASKKFLEYYATRLNAVEINYTFRRLPAPGTLQNWIEATPGTFLMAPKANQRITHIRRLNDVAEPLEVFLKSIDPLRIAHRLGPILFQLPPNLKADPALLEAFLKLLPADVRFSMEFRHVSWLTPQTFEMLGNHGVALCVAESEKLEVPDIATADFAYYRLRKEAYSEKECATIEARSRDLVASGKDVFLFFKHEETPDGALYAERMLAP
ncbi:MAG: DUF72 domain-containing protein [Bryobacteraceae bacterium]